MKVTAVKVYFKSAVEGPLIRVAGVGNGQEGSVALLAHCKW